MIKFNPLLIVCCITFFAFMVSSCSHENIGRNAENVFFVGESEDNIHVDYYAISLNVTPLDTSAFSFNPNKGLIVRNNLYVMDSRGIFKLDIETGSLLAFYDKKGHGLMNICG